MLAISHYIRRILEEGCLPHGLQSGDRAVLASRRPSHAQAKLVNCVNSRGSEWLQENASNSLIPLRPRREDPVRSIARTVEVSTCIADRILEDAPRQLRADIAQRDQIGRHRPLRELQIPVGLQDFQSDRLFELPNAELREWQSLQFQVRLLDLRIVLAEVRHEAEVDIVEQRTFKQWPHAAEQERVQLFAFGVGRKHAVIRLNVTVDLQMCTPILSGEPQPVMAERDRAIVVRRGFNGLYGRIGVVVGGRGRGDGRHRNCYCG